MKVKLVLCAMLAALLFLIPLSATAQEGPIVIPYSGGWSIDGEVDDDEWAGAVELPLEGLPLRTQAMHDGEALYLAFEVVTPAESWETFAVFDDGDETFYGPGDHMVLCDESGCQLCTYEAAYDFDCPEALVSVVNEGVSELDAPITLVGMGQVVFGVILDGIEHISQPFDLELESAPPTPTQPEGQPAAPLTTEPPTEAVSTSPVTVATKPAEDQVTGARQGLPGWAIPAIAGILGLAVLLALLMLLGRGKRKPDPCEEWYHMFTEDAPDGYSLNAKAECDNGKKPDWDPKKASTDRIRDGIKELEKQPQSKERDSKIKELQQELKSREQNMPETAVVPKSEGAELSVTTQGIPKNVPVTIEWQAETLQGEQPVGTGAKTTIPPEKMQQLYGNTPSSGVVKVQAKITICPGTPQEVTIYSNTVQIVSHE